MCVLHLLVCLSVVSYLHIFHFSLFFSFLKTNNYHRSNSTISFSFSPFLTPFFPVFSTLSATFYTFSVNSSPPIFTKLSHPSFPLFRFSNILFSVFFLPLLSFPLLVSSSLPFFYSSFPLFPHSSIFISCVLFIYFFILSLSFIVFLSLSYL